MDSYRSIRKMITAALAAALIVSTASTPKVKAPEEQCFLFPQFLSAAAASRESDKDTESDDEPEIKYTFGFLELIKSLYK